MPRRIKGGAVSAHETKAFVEQSYLKSGLRDDRVGDWVLDRELSSDRAAVYHNPVTGKTLVSNRGTTGTASDWSNNAQYLMGTYDDTDRLKHAIATQDAAIARYGKVDTNIGHSQGAVITRKLNELGKTGEVINLNGASMFEKQANNETRIRSSHDLVSAMASLAPSRKRNVTISGNWDPLGEHSAGILDRLNPMQLFGKGAKDVVQSIPGYRAIEKEMDNPHGRGAMKIKSNGVTKMPKYSYYQPPAPRRFGGSLQDEAETRRWDPTWRGNAQPVSPAEEERRARHGGRIGDPEKFAKAFHVAFGGKIGINIAKALGDALETAIDDSSTRLSSTLDGTDPHKDAHYGGKIGSNILKSLGKALITAIDDGSTRLTSTIDGSDPHKDAQYGSGFGGAAYVKKAPGTHKPNPWLAFVKAFRARNTGLSYKEVLKAAALEYRRRDPNTASSRAAAERRRANTEYE